MAAAGGEIISERNQIGHFSHACLACQEEKKAFLCFRVLFSKGGGGRKFPFFSPPRSFPKRKYEKRFLFLGFLLLSLTTGRMFSPMEFSRKKHLFLFPTLDMQGEEKEEEVGRRRQFRLKVTYTTTQTAALFFCRCPRFPLVDIREIARLPQGVQHTFVPLTLMCRLR